MIFTKILSVWQVVFILVFLFTNRAIIFISKHSHPHKVIVSGN
jgi:hypothetical protein